MQKKAEKETRRKKDREKSATKARREKVSRTGQGGGGI